MIVTTSPTFTGSCQYTLRTRIAPGFRWMRLKPSRDSQAQTGLRLSEMTGMTRRDVTLGTGAQSA